MLKKKISNSSVFTNVKKIENGILYLKDNTYAKFFSVIPIDLSLTNKDEQDLFYYTLSQLYKLKVVIKAYKYDEKINLTPTEFDIFWYLCKNRGNVVKTEDLFMYVWKEKYLDNNNTVMVHIKRIREKLKEDTKNPKFIKTVWGVGYKIER